MAMTIPILKIILESRKIISSSRPDGRKEKQLEGGKNHNKFSRLDSIDNGFFHDA